MRDRAARRSTRELRDGQIQDVDVDARLQHPVVVGDGMAGTPGVAAKRVRRARPPRASTCARSRRASSERNISVVIDGTAGHEGAALGARGLLSVAAHVSIGLIGPGTVGRVLLDQIASQVPRLLRRVQGSICACAAS